MSTTYQRPRPTQAPSSTQTIDGLTVDTFVGTKSRSGSFGPPRYYRHDLQFIGPTCIGRVQHRFLGNHLTDTTTLAENKNTCVRGRDLPWLVTEYRDTHLGEREQRKQTLQPGATLRPHHLMGLLLKPSGILLEPHHTITILDVTPTDIQFQHRTPTSHDTYQCERELFENGLADRWLLPA